MIPPDYLKTRHIKFLIDELNDAGKGGRHLNDHPQPLCLLAASALDGLLHYEMAAGLRQEIEG